jgi:hypothetical protein
MLHSEGDLPDNAMPTMFSVLTSTLFVLANVSDSAARTLAFLNAELPKHGLKSLVGGRRTEAYAKFSDTSRIFQICVAGLVQDVIRGLGDQASLEGNFAESTVARHGCRGVDRSVLSTDGPR